MPLAARLFGIHRLLAPTLEGWTGHLRAQRAIFMAWQWHGGDRSRWTAEADRALDVVQKAADAVIGMEPAR